MNVMQEQIYRVGDNGTQFTSMKYGGKILAFARRYQTQMTHSTENEQEVHDFQKTAMRHTNRV